MDQARSKLVGDGRMDEGPRRGWLRRQRCPKCFDDARAASETDLFISIANVWHYEMSPAVSAGRF